LYYTKARFYENYIFWVKYVAREVAIYREPKVQHIC